MELEHLFQQTTYFMVLQMIFSGTLYVAELMGRGELARSFVRQAASMVVTFGPMSLLVYILVEVSGLS
jgi:hypothetical protein